MDITRNYIPIGSWKIDVIKVLSSGQAKKIMRANRIETHGNDQWKQQLEDVIGCCVTIDDSKKMKSESAARRRVRGETAPAWWQGEWPP